MTLFEMGDMISGTLVDIYDTLQGHPNQMYPEVHKLLLCVYFILKLILISYSVEKICAKLFFYVEKKMTNIMYVL